ncbi:MAG: energy transducer TonB [Cyclobacteriaceae bacterium]|nr:energy transducer TonB [Cyclobacteriaceae bacterium]
MENKKQKIDARIVDAIIEAKADRIKKSDKYKNLITWFSFSLSIFAIMLVFEWKTFDNGSQVQLAGLSSDFEDLIDVPLTQIPPPAAPVVQQPMIIEVPDDDVIEEEIDIDLDINMNEEDVIEEIMAMPGLPDEEAETIHSFVHEMPEPIGGLDAFYAYLRKNLKYPDQAARMGIEGRVFLNFVVERDGSLTDIVVMKGIGAGCDEEAIRVIQNAPKWKPGKQRDVAVRVRFVFPIVFKLGR